jgi:hypothetical protein
VHRKLIRRGQRSVTARLALGAPEAVLGVPTSEMAGRIVALEDLWADVAARRLCARLAEARDTAAAAAVLESAIAECCNAESDLHLFVTSANHFRQFRWDDYARCNIL